MYKNKSILVQDHQVPKSGGLGLRAMNHVTSTLLPLMPRRVLPHSWWFMVMVLLKAFSSVISMLLQVVLGWSLLINLGKQYLYHATCSSCNVLVTIWPFGCFKCSKFHAFAISCFCWCLINWSADVPALFYVLYTLWLYNKVVVSFFFLGGVDQVGLILRVKALKVLIPCTVNDSGLKFHWNPV